MIGTGAVAGGAIGLNGKDATDALQKIERAYDGIMDQIVTFMQSGVVDSLSEAWFGNDVIKFMTEKFQPAVEEVIKSTETVFTSVNDTVTQAAKNYDRSHNTNVFVGVGHKIHNGKINIEKFRSDNNGFVGITDTKSFEDVRKNLEKISTDVDTRLSEAKRAAENSGFYGGDQQEQLIASMEKIKKALSGLTEELNTAAKEALTATIQREEELAKANANTFTA